MKICNSKVILLLALNSVILLIVLHNGFANRSEETQGNGIAYGKEIEIIDASNVFLEVKEETDNSVKLVLETSVIASNAQSKNLNESTLMSIKDNDNSNSESDSNVALKSSQVDKEPESLMLEERNALVIGEDLSLENTMINFTEFPLAGKILARINARKDAKMPTVDDYSGDDEIVRSKIEGTDQWNQLIYEVATEEGVDPVYVKCIMAQETAGQARSTSVKNKNGTRDYGLMQVNSSWGDIYDYDRMLTDHRYAIWAGIDVLKCKSDYAQKFDKKPTIFNVSWFYNGYSKDGKEYAKEISSIYEDLTGNNAKTTEFKEL